MHEQNRKTEKKEVICEGIGDWGMEELVPE